VNQIIAKRMIKRQQMRLNRDTVQPFLTVRVAALNDTLEQAFRTRHASFRPLEGPAAACGVNTPFNCMLSLPTGSAPKVRIRTAARGLDMPNSCSRSRRVGHSRSKPSSWAMASGRLTDPQAQKALGGDRYVTSLRDAIDASLAALSDPSPS
jgi:hypothetical protein